jgi:hypothetical protein
MPENSFDFQTGGLAIPWDEAKEPFVVRREAQPASASAFWSLDEDYRAADCNVTKSPSPALD